MDDEYDYLERQLDGPPAAEPSSAQPPSAPAVEPAVELAPAAAEPHLEERRERRRDKDDKRRRSRSRSRDRKKERSRERPRSRSRSPRRASTNDRDRHERERSDRGHGGGDRRGDRGAGGYDGGRPRRAKTPPEVLAMREQEKELREMERSTRTVFAYNLSLKADERDIFEFFSVAGRVLDVKLITDKNTKRSKGFAYIEYAQQTDVLSAVALTGQLFKGQAMMVKSSEHEKNLAWEAQQQAKQNQAAAAAVLGGTLGGVAPSGFGAVPSLPGPPLITGPCKLSVENLNPQVAEQELQGLFQPFGPIEAVQIMRDPTGASLGSGSVQFSTIADATKAMQHYNGAPVSGSAAGIGCCASEAVWGHTHGESPIERRPPPGDRADASPLTPHPYDTHVRVHPHVCVLEPRRGGELDDDEGRGGMKLTAERRQALMARLATAAGMAPVVLMPMLPPPPQQPAGPKGVDPNLVLTQGVLGPSCPIPTPCILIKNMFSAAEESGENWDQEIGEDVKEECSKYGPVTHVSVDKNSQGFVYLKFASTEAAAAAQHALHGRFFAGRCICCSFEFDREYCRHFGL
ncbi:MAG: hypothetical protein WDW38_008831 [Sanguina aurantia]